MKVHAGGHSASHSLTLQRGDYVAEESNFVSPDPGHKTQ